MLALTDRVKRVQLPWPIVLASASPRRRELLRQVVDDFDVDVADLDEEALVVADPVETAERLAEAKAVAVAARHIGALTIGGDTVVALNGRQFAKPAGTADAVEMLLSLAGQTHSVISGVALLWPGGLTVFSESAKVTFRALTRTEAEAYVATGEPMDKAGAYAVQGEASRFIVRVDGDVDTVIGLPVASLRAQMARLVGY